MMARSNTRECEDTIVIGAGPAGLGAGLALGENALVLERGAEAGGLCGTVTLGGAVFDLGGHSFHTPHPAVRELVFGALEMEQQAREAWCFVRGEWIPYPFQKNFAKLQDDSIVRECQEGLERRPSGGAPGNLDEHLETRYGSGITHHFLRPYNEKLWGSDLTRLSTDWTGERIAASTGIPEAFSTEGGSRTPLQSGTSVAYPARGGYGEIFQALSRCVPRLRYGESVVSIDTQLRSLETAGGERLRWRRLISTLPLPDLLDLLPNVPASIRNAVERLTALPLTLVLVALKSRLETPIQRIYCPGDDFPGHKVVLNHNSSAYLRALPNHGVLVEISEGGATPRVTNGELCERVIRGLRSMRLLQDRHEVSGTQVVELPRGYPVPTHERAAIVGGAKAWLARHGIQTVGRLGEWAYINADEALHRGLCVGAQLGREAERLGACAETC